MKTQICNNCGRTLKLFGTGDLFEGKVVCGKCIKILAPQPGKAKVNYARIAVGAVGRAAEQTAKDRKANKKDLKANENIRYEKAKKRVVFFLNGCVTFFWLIVLLHLLAVAAVSVAVIVGFGR